MVGSSTVDHNRVEFVDERAGFQVLLFEEGVLVVVGDEGEVVGVLVGVGLGRGEGGWGEGRRGEEQGDVGGWGEDVGG